MSWNNPKEADDDRAEYDRTEYLRKPRLTGMVIL